MRKFSGFLTGKENIFLKNEADLDEPTFDVWKSELERELPTFWASMKR